MISSDLKYINDLNAKLKSQNKLSGKMRLHLTH